MSSSASQHQPSGLAWPQEYLHTIEVLDSKVAKINGRYNRVQLLSSGNKLTEAADGTVTLNGEPMPIGKKLHSWFQITFSNGSVTGFADWTGKWEISPPIGGSREIEIKLRESQLVSMYGVCCKGRAGKNELTQTRDGVTLNDEELGTGRCSGGRHLGGESGIQARCWLSPAGSSATCSSTMPGTLRRGVDVPGVMQELRRAHQNTADIVAPAGIEQQLQAKSEPPLFHATHFCAIRFSAVNSRRRFLSDCERKGRVAGCQKGIPPAWIEQAISCAEQHGDLL
ncbi:uncharacterized protein MKK02DRAFT_31656 [Dioszegia hungarica]|uniref:Uncharacterized protein n=1 Tax=Dioszegia hungarica TaxID=4972 RepID=A0AA38HD38_9TREE|nr:uncharacterized protein MKK02DRAFT_31656 [Dioszegia hungarica]KAI9638166.1 hypothetical protein MKK02DRAFT_31656 [Dioszegia hungarica]